MCVCVCVCERERERERDRQTEREREKRDLTSSNPLHPLNTRIQASYLSNWVENSAGSQGVIDEVCRT